MKFLWSEKRLMRCFLTKFQIFVREGKQDYRESSGEWILWSWVAELEVYSFLPSAIPVHFVHDSFTCIPLSWVYRQSNAMPIWWNNCFLKANHKASRMCNTTGHVAKLNYWRVQYSNTVSLYETLKELKCVNCSPYTEMQTCTPLELLYPKEKHVWWLNIYHWWQWTASTGWVR